MHQTEIGERFEVGDLLLFFFQDAPWRRGPLRELRVDCFLIAEEPLAFQSCLLSLELAGACVDRAFRLRQFGISLREPQLIGDGLLERPVGCELLAVDPVSRFFDALRFLQQLSLAPLEELSVVCQRRPVLNKRIIITLVLQHTEFKFKHFVLASENLPPQV
jgi:hypothetical protein